MAATQGLCFVCVVVKYRSKNRPKNYIQKSCHIYEEYQKILPLRFRTDVDVINVYISKASRHSINYIMSMYLYILQTDELLLLIYQFNQFHCCFIINKPTNYIYKIISNNRRLLTINMQTWQKNLDNFINFFLDTEESLLSALENAARICLHHRFTRACLKYI